LEFFSWSLLHIRRRLNANYGYSFLLTLTVSAKCRYFAYVNIKNLKEKYMKILSIIIIGLLVSNCSNSYVKNKKKITSPDDLQKFVNIYCDKNKSADKVIRMCGNGWSKDLNISENKAILSAKIKIADITSHSIVSNEVVTHKESNKGVIKTYDLTADSKLEDVSIEGYKIVHKKVLKEKNGWRTLVLIEYKTS
jgi:alpha-mannosidase